MRVLITGMFTQAALFAVRRFAQMGCEIAAADGHRLAFGMYSRYVSRRVKLPVLRSKPQKYAEAVLNELRRNRYDFYFPTFEEIFLLSRYRKQISELTDTVLPSPYEILSLHDKSRLNETAVSAGVDAPKTFAPGSLADAKAIAEGVDFPVVLKLRQTCNSGGLVFVENPADIAREYIRLVGRHDVPENALPIIQQWVRGPLICTLELAQRGAIKGQVLCQGIRTVPRVGGTTVARQSVRHELCEEASRKVIGHLGFSGFIGFDYIVDDASGKVYLIDCNPRCSVNIHLAARGGCDMISSWIDIAAGREAAAQPAAREAVKTKTHFADAIWLAGTFFKGPENRGERALMRRNWFGDNGYFYDIMDKKDWRPTLLLCAFLLYQTPKLFYSGVEPGQLFLYYNQYPDIHSH